MLNENQPFQYSPEDFLPQELSELDFQPTIFSLQIEGAERKKEFIYVEVEVKPPKVETRSMGCQAEYLLTFDVPCQTPTRKYLSQTVQCELLKESEVIFEDKDMQIIVPHAV